MSLRNVIEIQITKDAQRGYVVYKKGFVDKATITSGSKAKLYKDPSVIFEPDEYVIKFDDDLFGALLSA